MQVIYRISDNSYAKPKVERATKVRCLLNFLSQWPLEEVTVLYDKCKPETVEFLRVSHETTGLQVHSIDGGSSAQSFRIALETALTFDDSEIVYFVEDDYWHLNLARQALLEGLECADYVTLYDHPDKYIPGSQGGNPFIDESGSEITRVILTDTTHWKLTNSTTCTFACRVKTLRDDFDIWKKWCFATPDQTHPHDFQCFIELRERGRSLISPIPTLSTHCDVEQWLAPLIDWESEI